MGAAKDQVEKLSSELEDSKKIVKQQTYKVEEMKVIADDAKQAFGDMQEKQLLSEETITELKSCVRELESSRNNSSDELVSSLRAELEETKAELEKQRTNFTDNVAAEVKKI